MSDITAGWSTEVVFYLNGKRVVAKDVEPDEFLVHYLRTKAHLTGTKLVCGEGACGACSVILTRFDPASQRLVHRAVNSCLYPVCACHGCAITTVEGIGSVSAMSAMQKALADNHGSQCGFCSPGFVTTVEAYRAEHPDATAEELETSLDGNICRCTGYRAILQAVRAIGKCDGKGGCGCHDHAEGDVEDMCAAKGFGVFRDVDALKALSQIPVKVLDRETGLSWYAPRDLQSLLELKARYPDSRLVSGNSEVGVEMRMKRVEPHNFVLVSNIPEINFAKFNDEGLLIGGAMTLTSLDEFIVEAERKMPAEKLRTYHEIHKVLQMFACRQVRNVACVGGNLATASPTSDLGPIFMACNAKITVQSAARGIRVIDINDWFVGYRNVSMQPDEVILHVFVPFTRPNEYVADFKVSRRKEDDIHLTNACFRVVLKEAAEPLTPPAGASEVKNWTNPLLPFGETPKTIPEDQYKPSAYKFIPVKPVDHAFVVEEFKVGMGSMSFKTVCSPSAAENIVGKKWSSDLLEAVFAGFEKDAPVGPNTPGGLADFRRAVLKSVFFKFFLSVSKTLYGDSAIPAEYLSALSEHERHATKGQFGYDDSPLTDTSAVNASVKHLAADKQCVGEAQYCDDTIPRSLEVHCALITSKKAHALIKRIDTTKAMTFPGVVGIYTAKDIPGRNFVGEMPPGEELFASKEVHYVGYPIGIVAAETHEMARRAAEAVEVEYEELPAVLTIKEAIDANSFHCDWFEIKRGDIDEGMKKADYVIDGEVVLEGQDHFYLEPQSAIVTPGEDGEFEILSSTQNPHLTQMNCAEVLGVPANRVVAKIKRAGGGFGGKETRSVPNSSACAIPAYHLHRVARLVLDRDIDMQVHGTRHPFIGRYRCGFNKDGRMVAYDVELYSNGGHSIDLSIAVLHRALFLSDNAYNVLNFRCRGRVCKTNRPSNTAFRGFGGPQGMAIIEAAVQRIAEVLGKDPADVRRMNMYVEGDQTHYDKVLEKCHMHAVWDQCMKTSCYTERRAAAEKFNRENRFKKRGVSIIPVKFGLAFTHAPLNQAGALAMIYTDGTVLINHGGCEIGQGLHTKMAQIAASALRVPLGIIHVSDTTTDKVPNTSATAASMQADLNGMAVLDACTQIRKRLDDFIKTLPEEPKDWKDLVWKAYEHRIDMSAHGFYGAEYGWDFKKRVGKVFSYYTFGAACSEVEVDTLTGEHTVLRSDVVMDLGKSLNPALDIGQIEGAFVQGMGWSTYEQIVYDHKGQLFSRGPGTYKVPGPGDVPMEFNVALLKDSCNPYAVHSSKGVGEPPLYLGQAVFWAIHEAVKAARADNGITGYYQMTLPATVERIRLACRDQFTDPPGISHEPTCWIEEYPQTPDNLVPSSQ